MFYEAQHPKQHHPPRSIAPTAGLAPPHPPPRARSRRARRPGGRRPPRPLSLPRPASRSLTAPFPPLPRQNQRAFQKQDQIFVGKKRVLSKKGTAKEARYYKNIGLGIKTPRGAIEGTYVDKKCPWTGSVNIRGKLITGVVKTTKMKNTVIIRKDYLHYIKKYNRFEKRHKNTPVHVSPAFRLKQGDEILAGQCRPISKTVRFNVLKVIRAAGGDGKKAF